MMQNTWVHQSVNITIYRIKYSLQTSILEFSTRVGTIVDQ